MPTADTSTLDATITRCLEEQYHAAECHLRARSWMGVALELGGGPDALLAVGREQLRGAYHSEQVRIRLDRINGQG